MTKAVSILLWLAIISGFGSDGAFAQSVWTKNASNPVAINGPLGAWNRHVYSPCVLYNDDTGMFEMWFTAVVGSPWYPNSIGYATSADGISWTMHPTPVLTGGAAGSWDSGAGVFFQKVIREDGTYKMWYCGARWLGDPEKIGYATSTDGINWVKYVGNPVMATGGAAWEAGGYGGCVIMSVPGGYKMWYAGLNAAGSGNKIGYATSVDGITWVRDNANNPILDAGAAGQWDDGSVAVCEVLRIGGQYYLWYAGMRSGSSYYSTGLAVSSDGVTNWTRDPLNPVLTSTPGTWDGNYVAGTAVVLRGNTLYMWYEGARSPVATYLYRIGLATSSPVAHVDDGEPGTLPGFLVRQNYPNPFNPSTTIEYALPEMAFVEIAVFDVLGRKVATLLNEEKPAGNYEIRWDADGAASGTYFCRIKAGSLSETRQMTLVK